VYNSSVIIVLNKGGTRIMKKLMSILMLMFALIVVGCNTAEQGLPELKDDDKIEMTAQEKVAFLQTVVEISDEATSNFRLDSFLDLEFAMTSNSEFNTDGMSSESNTAVTFDIDFDLTNYVAIGDSFEDTFVYSKFNTFEFNFLNDMYSNVEYGTQTFITDTKTAFGFSLSDTFFLARSDYAYYYLNGEASIEHKEDNVVNEEMSQIKSFEGLKEKTVTERITQEMYVGLMESMLELQSMLLVDLDVEMTEAELQEMYEAMDTYVSIYSSGNIHTIRLLVTTEMIDELINELFDSIAGEFGEFGDVEMINSIKSSVTSAFKAFNVDFRIILKGELEGQKHLSRIELLITGDFSGFTIDMADFGEGSFPVLVQMTVKLNRLGFTLNFDSNPMTLPSEAELDSFTLVEVLSFADIFEGFDFV